MLMCGHNLFGHLDGSSPSPPSTITQNIREAVKLACHSWFLQDQLIQNAIMASVGPTIASTVATASAAKLAGDALDLAYVNKSQTRIFSLHDQLMRLPKDYCPVAHYLHQVCSIYNELVIAGATVTNDELVVKILGGLRSDFHEIQFEQEIPSSRMMSYMRN